MRVMLAQLNATVGDIQKNTENILQAIHKARKERVDLVVFAELTIVGYPPGDFLELPEFIDAAAQALDKIIAASQEIAVIIGTIRRLPEKREKALYNTAAVIENGQLLGFQDKTLLPTYDVFDERRFFEPATKIHTWSICGQSVGITICEDMWQHSELLQEVLYYHDPIKELAAQHPDLVVNLSASPFSAGKQERRLQVAQKAAKTLKCPFLLCNQIGGNDSLIFDGYSIHLNGRGQLLQRAKGFEEDLLIVDLSAQLPPLVIPQEAPQTIMKEIHQALILGIRDYFNKSRFTKACIGLSGGIDSAVVACLATEALGKENILGVLMPSLYSSEGSVVDALQLAKALGIKTEQITIAKAFNDLSQTLAPMFQGTKEDITEENIQARIRGILLMALSNKFGYIVLSTGNKSELALGYCTLYGDMCGGLSVIGDLLKQQVYQLAHWINQEKEIIPKNTLYKPPSAELRPNQKDSDSLPDYSVIDNVLIAYVEENQSPRVISERFGYELTLVQDLIRRIHISEYKRRQSPPSLRVSDKAFSVGRHFPIVQGFVR